MKKSEFKEYLKTEILKMSEATQKDVDLQADLNAELEKTQKLMADMKEGKMKKSEFKEYLRQEILAEINEQEDDLELDGGDIELGDLEGEEEIEATIDPGESDKALALDDIGDQLVTLARKAKDVDERELANQILNSAM